MSKWLVDEAGEIHVVSGPPALRGETRIVPRRVIDIKPIRARWWHLNRWKVVPWSTLFQLDAPPSVTFKITPDTSTRNWRTEDLTKTIADQFRLPIDRLDRAGGLRFKYHVLDRASYEIVFEAGTVRFYFSVPETLAPLMKRRLGSVWPDARIEEMPADYTCSFDPAKTSVYELSYRKHHLYSLHTDAKDNLPLGSLFEAGKLVGEGERARVFAYFEPTHYPSYAMEIRKTWKEFREGKVPRKLGGGTREYIKVVLSGLSLLLRELVDGISTIMNETRPHRGYFHQPPARNAYAADPTDPDASADAISLLRPETREKSNKQATKTWLWVLAESEDKGRADTICRAMGTAFTDISGDNELEARPLRGKQKAEALRTVETKKGPRLTLRYNLMSTAENAKVVQIPGRDLIEKNPEVEHLDIKEVQIDKRLVKEGLELGTVSHKGETFKVLQPCGEKHWDEITLPVVVVGGMGQGKTKGFAANRVVQAVLNGYGALAIDPAKGEIGDEVEAVLPPELVERYNLAKMVFSLDWCEVMYSEQSRSILANTIFTFFEGGAEVAASDLLQTRRFFRAAFMALQTGKLSEILRIFEDEKYRDKAISRMRSGMHRTTLIEYHGYHEGRQRQIMSPIYNRLEIILGDDHLEECFNSDQSLDLVALTSKRKAIIFDVPAGINGLGEEGVDLVVNLLFTKLQLAMFLRKPENQFPFFIVMDEPAQYLRSEYLWKKLTVQSRKWRFGLVFLFHLFDQLDRVLIKTIKAALPHWVIYSSSKDTFDAIKSEIAPYTVDDGLKLKKHHAICVLRVDGEYLPPFVAKMSPPPSKGVGA